VQPRSLNRFQAALTRQDQPALARARRHWTPAQEAQAKPTEDPGQPATRSDYGRGSSRQSSANTRAARSGKGVPSRGGAGLMIFSFFCGWPPSSHRGFRDPFIILLGSGPLALVVPPADPPRARLRSTSTTQIGAHHAGRPSPLRTNGILIGLEVSPTRFFRNQGPSPSSTAAIHSAPPPPGCAPP